MSKGRMSLSLRQKRASEAIAASTGFDILENIFCGFETELTPYVR